MDNTERRQVPRFVVPPCQIHIGDLGHSFSVGDLSRGGISVRLVDRSQLNDFSVGRVFSGELKLFANRFAVSIQVRNIRGLSLGCELQDLSAPLEAALARLFDPKEMGAQIRPFEVPDHREILWYTAPMGVDLVVYVREKSISLWSLFWHGSVIQWDLDRGLLTGRTVAESEESFSSGVVRLETKFIEWDTQVDSGLSKIAHDLVESSGTVEANIRSKILGDCL